MESKSILFYQSTRTLRTSYLRCELNRRWGSNLPVGSITLSVCWRSCGTRCHFCLQKYRTTKGKENIFQQCYEALCLYHVFFVPSKTFRYSNRAISYLLQRFFTRIAWTFSLNYLTNRCLPVWLFSSDFASIQIDYFGCFLQWCSKTHFNLFLIDWEHFT